MRLIDGRWVCRQCGAVLDVPTDRDPKVVIKAASGKPNVRVLMLGDTEVHRCEIEPT